MLMLVHHNNILNLANKSITVPSQDMVWGLYYVTKGSKSTQSLRSGLEKVIFGNHQVSCYRTNEAATKKYACCKN